MGYKNANGILPESLLDAIQEYVDGEYLYIPRKGSNKKSWGELRKTRTYYSVRNAEISEKYKEGISVGKLSKEYYLSVKTIYRIIASN